jgi:uncharacterized repeat protein (TIGR01451 family)
MDGKQARSMLATGGRAAGAVNRARRKRKGDRTVKHLNAPSILMLGVAATLLAGGCKSDESTRAQARPADTVEVKPAPSESRTTSTWPTRRSSSDLLWTSLAYPTGDAKTSAIGLEKGLPREARVNQPFDYTLVVTNLTSQKLQEVVITDALDQAFKVTSSVPAAARAEGGTMRWNLGTLGPRESKTITVTGSASGQGEIGCCTGVSYNSLLCAAVPIVAPQLRVSKAGPAEALKCDEIAYRFEVSNPGTGSVTDVRITDPLPEGLETLDGKRAITFDVGTLGAGQSRTFNARVKATKTGSFQNHASATGSGVESVDSAIVTTVVREPVLTVKVTCPERTYSGRPIEHQVTVANTGDGVAKDSVVSMPVPPGTQFQSASDGGRVEGGVIRWTLGDLAPRATKTLSARVVAQSIGTENVLVHAEADCAKSASDSCQTVVTGIPAILLEVVDVEDPIQVGDSETYVITVTNQGSAVDTNIRIVCELEANATFVSASGATAGSAAGQTITFQPLAQLGAKEKATFRVVVKTVKAGDTRFKVTMTSDQLTRPVQETEATNIYE